MLLNNVLLCRNKLLFNLNIANKCVNCKAISANNTNFARYLCFSSANLSSKCINIKVPLNNQIYRVTQVRKFYSNKGLWSEKVVPFNLSDIGEGISEVVIKEWFIKVGDQVNQFDSICEVQSDKASVTITSRFDGVIEKIYYDIDETARVGKPLVDIRLEDESKQGLLKTDQVDQVADLEAKQICDSQSTNVLDWKGDKVLTTPAVRRIASENNIRLSDVKGTGKDGRILKEDLLKFVEDSKSSAKVSPIQPIKPVTQTFGLVSDQLQPKHSKIISDGKNLTSRLNGSLAADKSIPMTAIQRAMFKSMTQSLSIPHFGLSDEVNLSNLVNILPNLKERALSKGIKLTFMPIFIKALSLALHEYPIINSYLDEKNEKIILKGSHNIGFAMDTKDGLIVPNIKHVENLSILEIGEEMKRLQQDGANSKLRREDLTDATITLSNIGSIGGLFGIPVIPPSQVVIGAIGQMKIVPIFNEKGEIVKGHIVNVVWSADHRTIDGATLCRFSSTWKSLLQDPITMITEMK